MPIYRYLCSECDEESVFMHASTEVRTDCEKCDAKGVLTKMLNKPTIVKNKNKDTKVGEITKKYIEDNRDILNQQKEELKKKTYDKS